MGNELLASKTVTSEEPPDVVIVPSISTSLTGFVGITLRGPFGPTVVTSFPEFVKTYGGYITTSDLPAAVKGFFDNGGSQAIIVRVVHYGDVTDPTTKTSSKIEVNVATAASVVPAAATTQGQVAPWNMTNGQTLVISLDNGSTTHTATFNGGPAQVISANPATFAINNGDAFAVTVSGSLHSMTFSGLTGGAATAAQIVTAINTAIPSLTATATAADGTGSGNYITLRTSAAGGTHNQITVSAGAAQVTLGFATSVAMGTGNVRDLANVQQSEVTSIVTSAVPGVAVMFDSSHTYISTIATGSMAQIKVVNTSTAAESFDNANHMGALSTATAIVINGKTDVNINTLGIDAPIFNPPTSGVVGEFNLQITQDGFIVESFPNLSMDPSDPRYYVTIVNDVNSGSDLITLTDGGLLTEFPSLQPTDIVPDLITHTGINPTAMGGDGLTSISDADFLGAANAHGTVGTGLAALNATTVNILTVPGRATSGVHNGLLTYVEVTRGGDCFVVLDTPANMSATAVITYVTTTASLKGFSEFGAFYWPRIQVLNPDSTVYGSGANIVVCHSGHIAGVYAYNDSVVPGGIYQPPAGIERGILRGVLGLETVEVNDQNKRDLIYPQLINPIVAEPGFPINLDGVKTLKETGDFPTIAERRGMIFIEQSIKAMLRFVRHSNNDAKLQARATRSTFTFLKIQMDLGAFASRDPKTAFFVDFGTGLNTPAVVRSKKFKGRIGCATQSPSEWVLLSFSQNLAAVNAAAS